jgi:hypothetical protein
MHQDERGFCLTTGGAAAAGHLSRAIGSFDRWRVDEVATLLRAIAQIGLAKVAEGSLYAEAAALTH